MLFNKKFFLVLFFLQYVLVFYSQENSSCSLGKDINICNSSVALTSKSLLPGTWKILSGGGIFSNVNNASTSVSNLPDGVSTYAWSNNDNSCFDTISVILPKIGVSSVNVVGNGKVISPVECKVSYGGTLKFNTVGSVLPPTTGNVSSVAYFLYTCLPPFSPDVLQDVCANKGTFENINNLKNDGILVSKKPTASQTYWSVPVLSNDITLQGPQVDPLCQKTGVPIKFTLLNDITFTSKDHCKDGTSEFVFSGGDAEFFGSKFTISNIVSKKAVFSSISLHHGEQLTITNLVNGETISFDITDAIGYKKTITYLFPPCPACITTIGYNSNYCRYDLIASPIFFNGSGIGRLKISPSIGVVWDTITGIVDVKKSVPGTYVIKNISSKSCQKIDTSLCTLILSDTTKRPVSPTTETLCMPNPKVGNITSVVAQLITWYDKTGKKLDTDIDPVVDGETYYSTQTINGCESAKIGIKVLAPKVSPPQGDAIQFVCKDIKPTIANLKPNGNAISWYASPSGGAKLGYSFPLAETKYYATLKLNCESQQRLEVNVKFDNPSPPMVFEDTLSYCYSKELSVDSLSPNGAGFAWFAKTTDLNKLANSTKLEQGTYYVSTVNPQTNCYSTKVKVRVFVTELLANVQIFEPNCDMSDGVLSSNPSQGVAPYVFQWSNGSNLTTLEQVSQGNYSLSVKDHKGCKYDTIFSVDCRKKISSILTPDGNGKNDVWVVGYSNRFPNVKVFIYNRWGNLVYESPIPYEDNWDGKSNTIIDQNYVPTGTYFYQIFKTPASEPESGYIEVVK